MYESGIDTRREIAVKVTFVADFFVLTHTHHTYEGMGEDLIILEANEFLKTYYGFDIRPLCIDITVEEVW